MDKITEASLLYDFYGQLLTKKKQAVMELYHEENLSLAEIAAEFNISRAAVYDSLKKAEKTLKEYEEKIGLLEKFMKTKEAIEKIDERIDDIADKYRNNEELVKELNNVKFIISKLEEV